jgi:PAS domain S-box-containing protein
VRETTIAKIQLPSRLSPLRSRTCRNEKRLFVGTSAQSQRSLGSACVRRANGQPGINNMMSAQSSSPSPLERQQLLLDAVVDYAIYWLGPSGHIESWNPGGWRIKGYDAHEVLGQHFRMFFPTENKDMADRLLAEAVAEGRVETEGWRVRKDGSRFWALAVIDAIYDQEGQLIGFAKITRDMTERRIAQEQLEAQLAAHERTLEALQSARELLEARVTERTAQIETVAAHSQVLLRELAHRSKNLMAIITAMARHSFQQTTNPEHFIEAFTGRLEGISHSYDLLFKDDWTAVSLAELIRAQVSPFAHGTQLKISGPRTLVATAATQALGMAFHELATNAKKFGALSVPDGGKLEITWAFSSDQRRTMTLCWRETGGPAVLPPERTGWGTWVIRNMAAQVLNGEAELLYHPEGIEWILRARLGESIFLPLR